LGRAARGGTLAPEPPRVTRIQPESIRIRAKKLSSKSQVEPAAIAMAQPEMCANWAEKLAMNRMGRA